MARRNEPCGYLLVMAGLVPANATFAQELGRALHRPARLCMPAFVLRLAGGLADALILTGRRVLPDKALGSGFQFRHATLASALVAMLGPKPARATRACSENFAALPLAPAEAGTPGPRDMRFAMGQSLAPRLRGGERDQRSATSTPAE